MKIQAAKSQSGKFRRANDRFFNKGHGVTSGRGDCSMNQMQPDDPDLSKPTVERHFGEKIECGMGIRLLRNYFWWVLQWYHSYIFFFN